MGLFTLDIARVHTISSSNHTSEHIFWISMAQLIRTLKGNVAVHPLPSLLQHVASLLFVRVQTS
jgi:hypothetical protein